MNSSGTVKIILSPYRPNFCQIFGKNEANVFLKALIKNPAPFLSQEISPLTTAKRIVENIDCSRGYYTLSDGHFEKKTN